MPSPTEPPTAAQPSVTQFTLRGLAIVVIVSAGLSALLMPWMRSHDALQQQGMAAAGAGAVLGIVASVLDFCYRRLRAERKAGYRYLSLANPPTRRRPWISGILNIALVIAVAIWNASNIGSMGVDTWQRIALLAFLGFFWGAVAGRTLISIWWNRINENIELCGHGVIVKAIRFDPWEQFHSYRWEPNGKRIELHREAWVTSVLVPNELRHKADEILNEHLPRRGSLPG